MRPRPFAFGLGGFLGAAASDLARLVLGSPAAAYGTVFAIEGLLFLVAAVLALRLNRQPSNRQNSDQDTCQGGMPMHPHETFDVAIVGGGPSGATAASVLARQGHSVLLLDRAGRIKPCGGAIPPRLIRDFDIPDELLVARVTSARIVSPKDRHVDMPIDGGFVGMVDRDVFDEWLRERAASHGAIRQNRHLRGIRARCRWHGRSALSDQGTRLHGAGARRDRRRWRPVGGRARGDARS